MSQKITLEYRVRESDGLNDRLDKNNLGNAYYVLNGNATLYADKGLSQQKYVVQSNTAFSILNVHKVPSNGQSTSGDLVYELKDNIDGSSIFIKGGTYVMQNGKIYDTNLYSSADIRYQNHQSIPDIQTKGGAGFQFDDDRVISYADGTAGGAAGTDSTMPGGGPSGDGSGGGSGNGEIYPSTANAVNSIPGWFTNIEDHMGDNEREAHANAYNYYASNGTNYKDFRMIFGMPYQFLPSTDARIIPSSGDFRNPLSEETLEFAGIEFSQKIMYRMPLLFITPGNTAFMGQGSNEYKETLISRLLSSAADALNGESLRDMLDGYVGKLYTIVPAVNEYYKYVNPMCRIGAIFLGLDEKTESGEYKYTIAGKDLTTFHWGWNSINEEHDYELFQGIVDSLFVGENDDDKEYFGTDLHDITARAQGLIYHKNTIPFYINSEASFQDSFSNEVADSSLATAVNALSDRAREIQFLLGTSTAAIGDAFDRVNMDESLSEVKESIENIVSKISGGNSIFSTIANSVRTIVSGGRMLFPQIWTNSNFSKSYNISIRLTTPSCDKFSWWLNIYVPMCHLMALVLPRSEYTNSYTTPFLIKAFYRGMFNIDMGIITEMSFTKGKDGSWTKDALPTVVDVSFTMQDLYSAMGMTSTGPGGDGSILGLKSMFKGGMMQNIAEMDYLANLCGFNINEPDTFRLINIWFTLNFKDKIADFIPNLGMDIRQMAVNTILDGNLWHM